MLFANLKNNCEEHVVLLTCSKPVQHLWMCCTHDSWQEALYFPRRIYKAATCQGSWQHCLADQVLFVQVVNVYGHGGHGIGWVIFLLDLPFTRLKLRIGVTELYRNAVSYDLNLMFPFRHPGKLGYGWWDLLSCQHVPVYQTIFSEFYDPIVWFGSEGIFFYYYSITIFNNLDYFNWSLKS